MTANKIDFEDKEPGFCGLALFISFTHLTQNVPPVAPIQTYFQAQPVGW
jgi:hypothetical protein